MVLKNGEVRRLTWTGLLKPNVMNMRVAQNLKIGPNLIRLSASNQSLVLLKSIVSKLDTLLTRGVPNMYLTDRDEHLVK